MVCMTNKDEFLVCSTHYVLSMVMVMMLSTNPSIEASFASIFTTSWSALTSGSEAGRYSSLGSKCPWGNWRFVAYHGASARRLFLRSISASVMVDYSAVAGVVPKYRHRQRNASFPTIAMNFDAICAFVWTRRYAASRSIFPITMRFEGHLMRMAAIMWSIPRRQNT